MKKIIILIIVLLSSYAISQASILTKQSVELEVGSNPVSILENPSDGIVHIFCAGIDANDNNTFDEGEDEKPSWWTYNPAGSSIEPMMVKEFDNYFVSPFKPSVDTIKGYTTVILPFAASKTDGEFTGNGYVQGFQMKNTVPAFKTEVENGEYLYFERQIANTISVIRVNGNDSLIVENELNNQVDAFELMGDVIEYVSFWDEDDSQYFAPVYFDGDSSRIAVFSFDIVSNINELFRQNLSEFGVIKDLLTSITAFGEWVYVNPATTDSVSVLYFLSDLNRLVKVNEIKVDYTKSNKNHITALDENIQIISKESKDIAVQELRLGEDLGNIEIHRSQFEVGFIYKTEKQVYCASVFNNEQNGGRISIYDITKEDNYLPINHNKYTGYQPLDVFDYGNNSERRIYSVCLGVDFNFDGEIKSSEGDLPPSIWASTFNSFSSSIGNAGLRMELPFPINFPLNTNISFDGDILLPSGNKAYYYNVEDNEIHDSIDAEMYVTCAFSVLDYLVLGQRDMEEEKNYVRIKKGDFIDVKTEVGINVIDCIVYQNTTGFGVVSLSEGNFGKADSKLNIIKLSTMGIGENTEIEVGTGGNSIVTNNNQTKAAIVMNGSHEVHILNLLTGNIDLTFSTGTTGYGGPRSADFYEDLLFVTTYSNQLIVFDAISGKKYYSFSIDGNSEGISSFGKSLAVTNNQYSNYSPNNRIYMYNVDGLSDIEDAIPNEQTIRVYPHPVSNDFHIVSDDLAGTNDIAIINSQGKIVATHSGSSNGAIALNADALGLVAGNYTAIINGTRAVRFVVIK